MSTTSHKSRTRTLSEAAMKKRVHTSKEDRSRTLAGKDLVKKVHDEGQTLKVLEREAEVKRGFEAKTTKSATPNNRRPSGKH